MKDAGPLNAAKAAAWMAFAKGLATLGNRDAGKHMHTFESWWECYGAKDAKYVEDLIAERDDWKRRALKHGCQDGGDLDCG